MIVDDRPVLRRMLREHSVRFGHVKLASGQTSEVYVDAKLTTCRARAMPLVGRLFLRKMEEHGWKPSAVGGLSLGGDLIAMSIAHESSGTGRPIDAFGVRKEPKKHGTMKLVEGLAEFSDAPVVIVEDVCTTGGSTIIAIENARAAGLRILGAICLVDREMGAAKNIEALACPFDVIFKLSELVDGIGG